MSLLCLLGFQFGKFWLQTVCHVFSYFFYVFGLLFFSKSSNHNNDWSSLSWVSESLSGSRRSVIFSSSSVLKIFTTSCLSIVSLVVLFLCCFWNYILFCVYSCNAYCFVCRRYYISSVIYMLWLILQHFV